KVKNLQLKGIAPGSQPFVLWKDRQFATHRTSFDPTALHTEADTKSNATPAKSDAVATTDADPDKNAAQQDAESPPKMSKKPPAAPDPDLLVPADAAARAKYEEAFARFCKVFPDAFYVSERGRVFLDRPKERQEKGRFLSAGFHNSMGYFR